MTKVRCKDLPDSDRGDFSCRRAVDSSSLIHLSWDIVVPLLVMSGPTSGAMIYIYAIIKALDVFIVPCFSEGKKGHYGILSIYPSVGPTPCGHHNSATTRPIHSK